jgi:hypothetical protein
LFAGLGIDGKKFIHLGYNAHGALVFRIELHPDWFLWETITSRGDLFL